MIYYLLVQLIKFTVSSAHVPMRMLSENVYFVDLFRVVENSSIHERACRGG